MKIKSLLLCFLCLGTLVYGQSAEDIINTYLIKSGGLENWKALKSVKIQATMDMGQMAFSATIYEMPPSSQRSEISVQGQTIVQAFDGKDAWMINPFQTGDTTAQIMPDEMAESMKNNEFESDFINYKEKGHQITRVDNETIDGMEAFQIKLTKSNGEVEYHFFDTEKYQPIMVRTFVEESPGDTIAVERHQRDFRESNGLSFPYMIEVLYKGQTMQKFQFNSIEPNVEIDASIFAFPGEK